MLVPGGASIARVVLLGALVGAGASANAHEADHRPAGLEEPLERPAGARASREGPRRYATEPAREWIYGRYSSVQVNVDRYGSNIVGDAANEPSIAISPVDPRSVVIGWRQFDNVASNFREAGYAFSEDGGRSWTFPGVLEENVFRSDPVLASDAEGRFFYYSLTIVEDLFSVDLFESLDGGRSWLPPVFAFGGDKAWMTVDRTDGIGRGHIYGHWNSAVSCCRTFDFARSTDGGVSFEPPIDIPIPKMKWGTLDVAPDGVLFLAGATRGQSTHVVARSRNARDPTQTPVFDLVRVVSLGGRTERGGINPSGLLGQVWIATDPSDPTSRTVYVLASVEPPGPDPLDVHFVRSADGGETWSAPLRVNDDAIDTGAWQWFGTLSVAPNGRLDAIWNDTRNDPLNRLSQVFYSTSFDGGRSWSANTPVTPAFDPSLGYPNQEKLGDYFHMLSDNGGGNLAYAATFNGEQDVYFLRIPAPPVELAIDVRPGRRGHRGHHRGRVVRVVLLGSEVFDVRDVALRSLALGGDAEPIARRRGARLVDYDGDGFDDLRARFRLPATPREHEDARVCLYGELVDGTPFRGCDERSWPPLQQLSR